MATKEPPTFSDELAAWDAKLARSAPPHTRTARPPQGPRNKPYPLKRPRFCSRQQRKTGRRGRRSTAVIPAPVRRTSAFLPTAPFLNIPRATYFSAIPAAAGFSAARSSAIPATPGGTVNGEQRGGSWPTAQAYVAAFANATALLPLSPPLRVRR